MGGIALFGDKLRGQEKEEEQFMSQTGLPDQLNIPRFDPPKISGGALRVIGLLLVAALAVATSFYQIGPEEVGVVVRFGAHVGTTEPGLHFKLPFGIDKVYKLPALRELNEEFGFRSAATGRPADRRSGDRVDPRNESNMLTGDLNAAVVQWVVQYRISDPFDYLFQVRNVSETFRDMSEAVMREVVGERTVNEVLTTGRRDVGIEALHKLNQLCKDYSTGILVERVVLQDVTPPEPVKPAFNAVNQAQQQREKLINEAQSEYNKVVPRARGEAQQTISAAEGYALERVNRAEGEASRFASLYSEYRKAPEITRKRMYLETMAEVVPKIGRKIVIGDDLSGVIPLLNLDGAHKAGGGGGGQ